MRISQLLEYNEQRLINDFGKNLLDHADDDKTITWQWNLTFKSGRYLPGVPVDSLCEILSGDSISSTELKQEAIAH